MSILDQIYGMPKVASGDPGDLDLSTLSAPELLELAAYLDAEEQGQTETMVLEKMASDGSFDFYDMAGRIMARAQMDEMSKFAGGDDEVLELDLDQLSVSDLMELEAAGYEFAGMDKEAAGAADLTRNIYRAVRGSGSDAASATWRGLKGRASSAGASLKDVATAGQARAGASDLRATIQQLRAAAERAEGYGNLSPEALRAAAGSGSRALGNLLAGAGKTGLLYGAVPAGVAGATGAAALGGGAYVAHKKGYFKKGRAKAEAQLAALRRRHA